MQSYETVYLKTGEKWTSPTTGQVYQNVLDKPITLFIDIFGVAVPEFFIKGGSL